jgi:hypothetical protein
MTGTTRKDHRHLMIGLNRKISYFRSMSRQSLWKS